MADQLITIVNVQEEGGAKDYGVYWVEGSEMITVWVMNNGQRLNQVGGGSDLSYEPGPELYMVQESGGDIVNFRLLQSFPYAERVILVVVEVTDVTNPTQGNNGSITISLSGGIAPYQVRINGGQWIDLGSETDRVFSNLGPGQYLIEALDADLNAGSVNQELSNNIPADGTFLRNDCNGVNLTQVLADGNGGERWGNVVEENSTSCGYVVLGCTDPEADNYNPSATPGNSQANACTYSPRVFSEVKVIEVMECAPGVCLRWFNTLGGIDTWVFQGKVDRPFVSEAVGEYALADGLKASSKSGQPSMVLRTSSLNYNRYQALWQLFTSPKVWIHHPDDSTEEVYVLPTSVAPMPLGRNSYDLTVELSKAPINTLRK